MSTLRCTVRGSFIDIRYISALILIISHLFFSFIHHTFPSLRPITLTRVRRRSPFLALFLLLSAVLMANAPAFALVWNG